MIYLELNDVLAITCEILGSEVKALLLVTDIGLAVEARLPKSSFAGQDFQPTLDAKSQWWSCDSQDSAIVLLSDGQHGWSARECE